MKTFIGFTVGASLTLGVWVVIGGCRQSPTTQAEASDGVDLQRPDPPVVLERARVKRATSPPAQSDASYAPMYKIIVKWGAVAGAVAYEVCIDCNISDKTGQRDKSDSGGSVRSIEPIETCGGVPCLVFKEASQGEHRYSVRAKTARGWSRWGEHRKFLTDESTAEEGHAKHAAVQ